MRQRYLTEAATAATSPVAVVVLAASSSPRSLSVRRHATSTPSPRKVAVRQRQRRLFASSLSPQPSPIPLATTATLLLSFALAAVCLNNISIYTALDRYCFQERVLQAIPEFVRHRKKQATTRSTFNNVIDTRIIFPSTIEPPTTLQSTTTKELSLNHSISLGTTTTISGRGTVVFTALPPLQKDVNASSSSAWLVPDHGGLQIISLQQQIQTLQSSSPLHTFTATTHDAASNQQSVPTKSATNIEWGRIIPDDDNQRLEDYQAFALAHAEDENDVDDDSHNEGSSYNVLLDNLDYDVNATECATPTWIYRHVFPVCNIMHELSLLRTVVVASTTTSSRRGSRPFLGSGYFRDSWLLDDYSDDDFQNQLDDTSTFVLKQFRYRHPTDAQAFRMMHTEAVILEATTASPATINMFGYCATSLLVEAATEVTYDIVPYIPALQPHGRGRISHDGLIALQELQSSRKNQSTGSQYNVSSSHHHHSTAAASAALEPYSFNNFTAAEKLDLALQMAEGLAELHGLKNGIVVNDDVHPDQWLQRKNERRVRSDDNSSNSSQAATAAATTGMSIMLNDMNNAVFLDWNVQTNDEYCDYYSVYGGDYRAPEEYHEPDDDDVGNVNESADIWPMGNLIYSLLTGLWPYHDLFDEHAIQNATMAGIKPALHPAYRYRSFIERRLTEIMDRCHVLEPADRVDIFTVVQHLRETKRLSQLREHQTQ